NTRHWRPFPDRFAAYALQSPAHGSLGARKSAANRGVQRDVLLRVNNTREISKDHFYPTHMIDAATGAIHIFQTHARALDGFRKFPKFHVELSPYGRPGVLVEIDSQSSDVSLNRRLMRQRGFSPGRLRGSVCGDVSFFAALRTGPSAPGLGSLVLPGWSDSGSGSHNLATSLGAAPLRSCDSASKSSTSALVCSGWRECILKLSPLLSA